MKQLKVLHIGKYYPPVEGGIEHFLCDLVSWQARHFPVHFGILVHNPKPLSEGRLSYRSNCFIYRAGTVGSIAYAPISFSFPAVLYKILRTYRPEIVHVHMPNLSAFWLLVLKFKAPLVVHWHSDVVPTPHDRTLRSLYPFYRRLERLLLKRASSIIATSPPYLETSFALKDFRKKCLVIPLGIDPTRLGKVTARKIRGPFFILSVGRFTYYKGFRYLIEAMKYLNDAFLVIVGDGALWKSHKRDVAKLGLGGRVSLPGRVSNEELADLLYNCDVFCLPSVERTEAFGLVLLEAMSFSKPLITTTIEGSGVTWVNQNHVTGLHVPPGDPEALAKAFEFLKENPDVAKRYGENGKNRFEHMFHISIVARQIWDLYEKLP